LRREITGNCWRRVENTQNCIPCS